MDASEWENCQDRNQLLAALQGRASDRKLRLVAAPLCRSVWEVMDREESCQAVLAVEQFADGLLPEKEFLAARARSREAALYATEVLSYSPHDVDRSSPRAVAAFALIVRPASRRRLPATARPR
jgi:hypothetical protein